MAKKIIFLACLFLLFGYQFLPHYKNTNWTINLKHETNSNINLELSYINYSLSPLDRYPILKERVAKTYKGIPAHDSISFYGNYQSTFQAMYDLYKKKQCDRNTFLAFIEKTQLDTLNLSKKPLHQGFISIVGFYKNKQFLIADANRNEDFSDDIKYEFNINFRKNPLDSLAVLTKLPQSKYAYETYYKGNIHSYSKNFILYPSMYESHIFDEHDKANYLSKLRYTDYWKGEKTINKTIFEFYYQSIDNAFGAIYIKPKNIIFSKTDDVFNNQFMHYTNDTIAIANHYYKIDSINRDISKLYIREIAKNNKNFGNYIGNYLKNYKVKNLEDKSLNTSEIIKRKKYTLMEFWSTNCGPCIKMLPKLKKTQTQFSSTLNLMSITSDKDKKEVNNFIQKKNMNGTNIITNFNDPIFKELRIGLLPTYILVDSKSKILFRGGVETYDDMLKIIK